MNLPHGEVPPLPKIFQHGPARKPGSLATYGERLIANGYRIIPIAEGSKRPLFDKWQKIQATPATLQKWLSNGLAGAGIGIITGSVAGVDIDILDEAMALGLEGWVHDHFGLAPVRVGKAPKRLLLFRTDAPFRKITSKRFHIPAHPDVTHRVEILCDGQQFVAFHIHPETYRPFEWLYKDGPHKTKLSELPAISESQAREIVAHFESLAEAKRWQVKSTPLAPKPGTAVAPRKIDQDHAFIDVAPIVKIDEDEFVRRLMRVPNAEEYDTWLGIGMALCHQYDGGDRGLELWHEWSRTAPNYEQEALNARWEGLKIEGKRRAPVTARLIMKLSNEAATAPELSEEALALEFAQNQCENLRFVPERGWLFYDNGRWRRDTTKVSQNLIRAVCREDSSKTDSAALARRIASAKTVQAVEHLALSDRRLVASADSFDADDSSLNTPSGVADLQTGSLRPHARTDYMTRMTSVAPASPGTQAPQWNAFLNTVTAGDPELIGYLQRVAGYVLSGKTTEQALFFLYGTGGNGKGVFVNTLAAIMGDYATSTPIETLTESKIVRHPTELADLHGARLVTASETEEGRYWAESRIKQLTGGDPVKARFMRRDFFEYRPKFKLMIQGNHRPRIKGVDEAMRRRLQIVPFEVKIDNPDLNLWEKLKTEWPAILRWAIDGAVEWSVYGLSAPERVLGATRQYLTDEDNVAQWLEENCDLTPDAWESTQTLFTDFTRWVEARHEFRGSMKRFAERLEQLGVTPHRRNTGRGFRGIALLANSMPNVDGSDGCDGG